MIYVYVVELYREDTLGCPRRKLNYIAGVFGRLVQINYFRIKNYARGFESLVFHLFQKADVTFMQLKIFLYYLCFMFYYTFYHVAFYFIQLFHTLYYYFTIYYLFNIYYILLIFIFYN